MRICVLTASVSHSAGGLFYSVRSLSKSLMVLPDVEIQVWAISGDETERDVGAWKPLDVHLFKKSVPGKFGFSLGMLASMLVRGQFDAVHLNGLWGFPSLVAIAAALKGIPVVVSPRGMLDPWITSRHNLIKRAYYYLVERFLLQRAYAINALSEAERLAVDRLGFGYKAVKIPNGVDLVAPPVRAKKIGRRRLIYIGRYDEKKGLLEFLDAWKRMDAQTRADWQVHTYGWGDPGYEAELRRRVINHDLSSDWVIGGSVYGGEKMDALAQADAFVLPTKGEGLPMAVLEAWAARLPVLTTEHANLPEGFERGASFDLGALSEWPSRMTTFFTFTDEKLQEYGSAGLSLVCERFSWDLIAKSYKGLFDTAAVSLDRRARDAS